MRSRFGARTSRALEDDALRSEVFRVLRSNLVVALAQLDRPSVIVTSALPDEGKSAICANLAVSLAEAGKKVVAVDVDLRRPNLHLWLGGHNEVGLSDVLLEREPASAALQLVPVSPSRALFLLSTGSPVNDPTELLGSPRTGRLLETLAQQADIVLLDAPPVLPVADTLVIGRIAAGAVLVVQSRQTPVPVVQEARNALIRNQTRLLGVVLNKVQHRDLGPSPVMGYPLT